MQEMIPALPLHIRMSETPLSYAVPLHHRCASVVGYAAGALQGVAARFRGKRQPEELDLVVAILDQTAVQLARTIPRVKDGVEQGCILAASVVVVASVSKLIKQWRQQALDRLFRSPLIPESAWSPSELEIDTLMRDLLNWDQAMI